ncbi:MAG: phosphatase PAP2 family protein [Nocardioidaceae bacterium]
MSRWSGPDDSADDSDTGPEARDWTWIAPVWVLVALFVVVTTVRSRIVGIPFRDPHGSVFSSRFALSLGLFMVLAVGDAAVRTGRRGWTASRAAGVLARRWTPRRLALALSALLAYHLVYLCYHNLKSWDAFNRVRDGMLLDWDRRLFFGHTPALLLHDLLGQHVAAYVLMVVYESFSTVVSISVVAAVVLPRRTRDSYVFIASALWVWILGVGSYYLIPSIGPFHSAPQDFSGLPHTMIQSTQARYMAQRANLLAHPQAPHAFAQVSAFASLHVGLTCFILLMARYFRLRVASALMSVFLVATMVATVYLGWHFAVDDVAGVAVAALGVLLGRTMIYPPRPLRGHSLPGTRRLSRSR